MRSVAQCRLVLRQKMSQLCCSVKLLHRFFRSGYNLCPLWRALGMWGSDSPRNSADETGKRMLLSFSVKAVCYVYLASLKYFSVGWVTGIKANTFNVSLVGPLRNSLPCPLTLNTLLSAKSVARMFNSRLFWILLFLWPGPCDSDPLFTGERLRSCFSGNGTFGLLLFLWGFWCRRYRFSLIQRVSQQH